MEETTEKGRIVGCLNVICIERSDGLETNVNMIGNKYIMKTIISSVNEKFNKKNGEDENARDNSTD